MDFTGEEDVPVTFSERVDREIDHAVYLIPLYELGEEKSVRLNRL